MLITQKIDNVTEIREAYMSVTPPAPISLKIELTSKCDFKCFLCASNKGLRTQGNIDKDLFKSIVTDARNAGVEELGLFYLGESFLVSWLPEAIEFSKNEAGYPYVFLTTNGRAATEDKIKDCIEAGLDSLKFSFNSSDAENFSQNTGVKSAVFDEIIENIEAAAKVRDEVERKTGHRCGIYASSIQYNGDQALKMKSAVDRISPFVDEHYYLPLYNQGSLTTEEGLKKGYQPTAGNQGRWDALRSPLPCWAVFTAAHVTREGLLSACSFDHNERWTMGDLKVESFMEAWHSEPFKALRQSHLAKDVAGSACEKCMVC